MINKVYLEKMLDSREEMTVKAVTGVRGVGKTTLFSIFADVLRAGGMPEEQVIYIGFEETGNEWILDYRQLYDHVRGRIEGLPHACLLLDGVQRVEGWERAINAFFVDAPVDIYLAGSHAGLMTEDFVRFFDGHSYEIRMYPMSLREYAEAMQGEGALLLPGYLKYGGLPAVTTLPEDARVIGSVLSGIYYEALMRDAVQPNAVRDPALMDSMARFLATGGGEAVTARRLGDYLAGVGRKTTLYTMGGYLDMLSGSGLFHRVRRYDIRARAHLNGSERFYMADVGLGNMLRGLSAPGDSAMLENAVYLELRRRGFLVSVGKVGSMEVTFLAEKPDQRIYYQVRPSLADGASLKRALRPLKSIPDQYPKVILTMDPPPGRDFDGILNRSIADFLMGEDE